MKLRVVEVYCDSCNKVTTVPINFSDDDPIPVKWSMIKIVIEAVVMSPKYIDTIHLCPKCTTDFCNRLIARGDSNSPNDGK